MVGMGLWQQIFFNFSKDNFLLNFLLWRRDLALELHFLILFYKLCGTKYYWDVLGASFVVQSSTGTCFVQTLQYKVVLGRASCKRCSTK